MKYVNNLQDYLSNWRFRVDKLQVLFLDKNNAIIPNDDLKARFGMEVTYPKVFYDIDAFKVPHAFAAHPVFCRSIYNFVGEFSEYCEIHEDYDFDSTNFAPSLNGSFTFELYQSYALNMARFEKLKILIEGSSIPLKTSKQRLKDRFLNLLYETYSK